MRQTCAGLREDLTPFLKNISVPVLLLRGAESKLVSPEAWAKTKVLRPDVPAREIADADHYVPEEQPAAVAAAVTPGVFVTTTPRSRQASTSTRS